MEIGNRVVQPASLAELEVSNKEVELIMQVGFDFFNDSRSGGFQTAEVRQFVQWRSQSRR